MTGLRKEAPAEAVSSSPPPLAAYPKSPELRQNEATGSPKAP